MYGLGSWSSTSGRKVVSNNEGIATRNALQSEKLDMNDYSKEVQNTYPSTSLLSPHHNRVSENSAYSLGDNKTGCREKR